MKLNTWAALFLLAVAAAGLTMAAQPPTSADTTKIDFGTLDANSNGALSKEESRAVLEFERQFDALDTDQDRAVSPAEFKRWHRAGMSQGERPRDPATAPSGSAGAQHMPERE